MFAVVMSACLLQDPIPALIDRLRSGSIEERAPAEAALRRLGPPAAPFLEEAAKAGDAEFLMAIRRLLTSTGTTAGLVEDLRSDEIPGNARKARDLLVLRNGEAGLEERLLAAAESDDDQQAIQAGYVLLRGDQGAALWKRAPDLLERSVAAFARVETRDYEWVATEVLLRLAVAAPAEEADRAIGRALRGLAPHALSGEWEPTPLGRALEIARSRVLPLPPALVKHALLNLRHDEIHANAWHTRGLIEKNRGLFLPGVEALVADRDAQARRIAIDLLLDWNLPELPPGSPAALGELLGRDARALPRLCASGEAALPVLEAQLRRPEHRVQLEAARGLLTLAPDTYRAKVVDVAVSHLPSDGFQGNAWTALQLLVRCGPEAAPHLRTLLAGADEQVLACAAAGLAALGEKPELSPELRRRLYRLAARRWGQDEEACLVAALEAVDGLWEEVSARLQASGKDGQERSDLLYAWMLAQRAEGRLKR